MTDTRTDMFSGKVCTTSNGKPMIWRGHLCEGANLVQSGREFCLWTKCGKHDVPANSAHEGRYREVTCVECLKADQDTSGDELPNCVWKHAETPFSENY